MKMAGLDLTLAVAFGLDAVLVAHGADPEGGMQQKSRARSAALRFSNAGSVRHRTRALRERRRRTGDAMGVNMALLMR